MNCASLQESIVEYYLGELDEEQTAQVDQHLASGCRSCQSALADIQTGIGLLYEAGPEGELDDSHSAAILSRARQSVGAGLQLPEGPDVSVANQILQATPSKPASLLKRVGMCACSVAAGWLIMMAVFPSTSLEAERVIGQGAGSRTGASDHGKPPASTLASAGRVPADLRIAEDQFRTTSFVSLRQPANHTGPRGSVIWDPLGGEIHFFGFGFLRPAAGQLAVLWGEDLLDGTVVSAPLSINQDGRCQAVLPASTLTPPRVVVTIEPVDDAADQPAGEQLLIQEV